MQFWLRIICLFQGTPSASQDTSQAPRAKSISSRLSPDGQVVTNYMEEKSTSHPEGSCDSCDLIILQYSLFSASWNLEWGEPPERHFAWNNDDEGGGGGGGVTLWHCLVQRSILAVCYFLQD